MVDDFEISCIGIKLLDDADLILIIGPMLDPSLLLDTITVS